MAPLAMLDRIENLCDVLLSGARISVTDLSRTKDWRKQLPEVGIIEITDRGDTAGWLLSDDDMKTLLDGYEYLEKQLEDAQVAAIFEARKDSVPKTGSELQTAVLDAFEQRSDELMDMINAD